MVADSAGEENAGPTATGGTAGCITRPAKENRLHTRPGFQRLGPSAASSSFSLLLLRPVLNSLLSRIAFLDSPSSRSGAALFLSRRRFEGLSGLGGVVLKNNTRVFFLFVVVLALKRETGDLASQLGEEVFSAVAVIFFVVALCFGSGRVERPEGRADAGGRCVRKPE